MRYFGEIRDDDGYIHSVDMVVIDYYLKCRYSRATDMLLRELRQIDGFDVDKHASLGNLPSHKYMYYVDMIWFDGMVLYFGKYASYDKVDKSWTKLDMMRLKVNPNKHLDSPALVCVLDFLRDWGTDGYLVRWDYAIDVPAPVSDVLVIGSRKEPGLYKGTRYYGQRHKHGYLKIYDKAKEQGLDVPLTRLEYTYQSGLPPSWDNIVVNTAVTHLNAVSGLSKTLKLYLDMLIEIKALGGQIEPYVERMDFKSYKKIEPFLMAGKQLQLSQSILDSLIDKINDIFIIAGVEQGVKEKNIIDDDFVDCTTDLPFD